MYEAWKALTKEFLLIFVRKSHEHFPEHLNDWMISIVFTFVLCVLFNDKVQHG